MVETRSSSLQPAAEVAFQNVFPVVRRIGEWWSHIHAEKPLVASALANRGYQRVKVGKVWIRYQNFA
jgi:hypothetical protein